MLDAVGWLCLYLGANNEHTSPETLRLLGYFKFDSANVDQEEILNYQIEKSLFDVVILCALRVIFLLVGQVPLTSFLTFHLTHSPAPSTSLHLTSLSILRSHSPSLPLLLSLPLTSWLPSLTLIEKIVVGPRCDSPRGEVDHCDFLFGARMQAAHLRLRQRLAVSSAIARGVLGLRLH